MNKMQALKSTLIASGLIIASSQVYAAGFQVSEATVTGLGRAFAGAGVAGDDVSDMFYNPAGMFLAEGRQVQGGVSILDLSFDFEGSAVPFGGPGADGGETGVVPNFYYVFPENGKFKYGIAINAPFGLVSDYSDDWAGRFQGIRSELTIIDINPALAYQVTPELSIGGGISLQYADAELTSASFQGVGVPDGENRVEGDNWDWGYNLGIMYSPTASTRLGLGFRSKVNQRLDGDLTVTSSTGATLLTTGAEAEVDLPETVYISGLYSLNSRLDLMLSGRWTNWSRFDELRIEFDNGLPDQVTPENWEDSWTISVGANYYLNSQWTLRAGYAYDETPVPDEDRTVRIPDSDRDWFTFGASYSPNANLTLDFGYAYITNDDAPISETTIVAAPPTSPVIIGSSLVGNIDGDASIYGFQLQYKF